MRGVRHAPVGALACTLGVWIAACVPEASDRSPALSEGATGASAAEPGRSSIEIVMYMGGSGERALESFREHAGQISIVAPQAFGVDSAGTVLGEVSPALIEIARESGVNVMPLIHNPGFDQPLIHALLRDPAARARTIRSMVGLALEHGFWGWQFDFENIHASDRDALTRFYRETAEALHAAGVRVSIAVVPPEITGIDAPFANYMRDNWRSSFDLVALDTIGDFMSFMTYAQHGGITPPGPIAGLPWMRAMLDHALGSGVAPERLSLGIPSYSGYWSSTHDEKRGGRAVGREIPFSRATELLEASGAPLQWLPEQGVHHAFWESAGVFEWIFLEDERSLEAKLDLFRSYPGLRGVSVWVLGAEGPGFWPTIREHLDR
jgi:spore germination protein YaaH